MAEHELSIIVRAKDQLSAVLRAMGTSIGQLAKEANALGDLGLGKVGTSATSLTARLQDARTELSRLTVSTAPQERIDALTKEIRETEDALDALNREAGEIDIARRVMQAEQAFELLGSRANLGPLRTELQRGREELERLRAQAQAAGGSLSLLEQARLDRLENEVNEGEAALRRLRVAEERASQGATTLGRTFQTVGAGIKSALLPILPILTLAGAAFAAQRSVSQALELERALVQIQTEGRLTQEELGRLREGALATARALGLSEADAAPALLSAVTDGARNASEGLDRFAASAKLAAVTGADTAKATDLLTSALNAYRDSNLSAARAADVVFGVIRGGKVEVDELAGSLDAVLPLAAQLGVSFEELGAILVTATQRGGGFAQGIQAVRAALNALTDAGPEAREALAGVDFSQSRIRAEGLVPVLLDVTRALEGNAEKIRAVFPDGRSFGALLAVLANEGRDLSRALEDLERSGGAVEQALGTRLQAPVVQLSVIFNRLRSEFAQTFGGEFLRSVRIAIDEMGGFESATQSVAEIAETLGRSFGAALPPIGLALGALGESVADVVEQFRTGVGPVRNFGVGLLGTTRLAVAGLREFVEMLDLVFDGMNALAGLKLGIGIGQEELDTVNAALAETDKALAKLAARKDIVGPRLVALELDELREALNKAPNVGEAFIKITPQVDEATLGEVRRRLVELSTDYTNIVQGRSGFGELKKRLGAAISEFGTDTVKIRQSVDQAVAEIASAFADAEKPATVKVVVDAETGLRDARARVKELEATFGDLRDKAKIAVEVEDQEALGFLAAGALEARDALNKAREERSFFESEAARAIEVKIHAKTVELERAKRGMDDARSAAELLGIAGTAAAERLDAGFSTDKVKALEGELRDLERQLNDLRGEPLEIVVRPKLAKGFDLFNPRYIAELAAEAFARAPMPTLRAQIEFEPFKGTEVFGDEDIFSAQDRFDAVVDAAQRAADELATLREAAFYGVDVANRLPGDIEADLIAMREQAAAFAQRMQEENEELFAITLGIKIDDQAPQELREQIAQVQLDAQRFAQANPIQAEALTSGIRGFSQALGEIASGASSAKEALADFARSTVANLVQVAAQAAIVRALIAAFGGPTSGAGAFLASSFGVQGGAQGLVIPNAQGNVYRPAAQTMDFAREVRAFSNGGLPFVTPDSTAAAGGASPKFLQRALGGSSAAAVRYALGGSPSLDRIVARPTLEPAENLKGMAIVPLSGGGVATPEGGRLPVVRAADGELVIRRMAAGDASPSRSAFHALYGEAGAEAVMRTYPGPSLRAEDGGRLPLTRVHGGRLGVRAFAEGLSWAPLQPSAQNPVQRFAVGGLPGRQPPSAAPVSAVAPRLSVAVSVPLTINASQASSAESLEAFGAQIQGAVARSKAVREAIAAAAYDEMQRAPAFKGAMRGDRV